MAGTDDIARAGLFRRIGALVLDLVLVTLVLQVISAVAFPLTGGLVQISNGFELNTCQTLPSVPAGLPIPADFRPTAVKRCSHRFFAFPTGETITVSHSEVTGGFTRTQNLTWHVATNGEIITPIDPSGLTVSLLLLLRWLFDCGPGTPGRRLFRNWLVPGNDIRNAHGRAAQRRFGLRYLYLFVSILPASLAASATIFPWSLRTGASALDWITSLIGSTILLAPPLLAFGAILLRRDVYYDRLARTHVVRG